MRARWTTNPARADSPCGGRRAGVETRPLQEPHAVRQRAGGPGRCG